MKASEFTVGDVVARSLRGEVVVERVLSIKGDGVLIESSDGHTEYHPTSQHISVDDLLRGYRPATREEEENYRKVTCWECGRPGASWCSRCVAAEKVA